MCILNDADLAECVALNAERDSLMQTVKDNREGCAPRSIVNITNARLRAVNARIADLIASAREAA